MHSTRYISVNLFSADLKCFSLSAGWSNFGSGSVLPLREYRGTQLLIVRTVDDLLKQGRYTQIRSIA